jgi:hypothetical protein
VVRGNLEVREGETSLDEEELGEEEVDVDEESDIRTSSTLLVLPSPLDLTFDLREERAANDA